MEKFNLLRQQFLSLQEAMNTALDEILELEQENQVLRDALKEIAYDKGVHDGWTSMAMTKIAQEVLSGKRPTLGPVPGWSS